MGKYVCTQCGAEHAEKPETDDTNHRGVLVDPVPGPDNLESVMMKSDQAALKGLIKRNGVVNAYVTFFNCCSDEQMAELLQHQIKFFNGLAEAHDKAIAMAYDARKHLPPRKD